MKPRLKLCLRSGWSLQLIVSPPPHWVSRGDPGKEDLDLDLPSKPSEPSYSSYSANAELAILFALQNQGVRIGCWRLRGREKREKEFAFETLVQLLCIKAERPRVRGCMADVDALERRG